MGGQCWNQAMAQEMFLQWVCGAWCCQLELETALFGESVVGMLSRIKLCCEGHGNGLAWDGSLTEGG